MGDIARAMPMPGKTFTPLPGTRQGRVIDFKDFKRLSIFEEFLEICSNLIGLSFNLWNPARAGDRLFPIGSEYFIPFCKYIAESKVGRDLCRKCDMAAVQRAKQTTEAHIYECHAGLTEIALPLAIHGNVCAVLLSGQIMRRPARGDDPQRIQGIAGRLGLDGDRLYRAFLAVKVIPDDKIRDIVKWFSLFSSYVARLGHELRLTQARDECDSIGRVKEIILNRFDDDSISLQRIAREVHLSPSHLSRMFHRQTGTTLTDYRNLVRIEEAKNLLATTSLKICDVCYEVGYQSLSNFTRTFTRHVGVSPRMFRGRAAAPPARPSTLLRQAQ